MVLYGLNIPITDAARVDVGFSWLHAVPSNWRVQPIDLVR